MSGNDYLKFITEQLISYMDLSSEEKQKRKKRKKDYPIYTSKWLGMLPFTIRIMFQKENSR
ncbi:YqzE family protein [Oceanobacillus sp. CF4.6]|uniref:YqzE family protein n=1 Tax=Oceanobacillus sp. CF4.6 TaxID=3373080 RepID=UPI003EE5BFCB